MRDGIRDALHAARRPRCAPLQWHQLERLTDSGAWLPASATVPSKAAGRPSSRIDGLRQLVARDLAEDNGACGDRWRVTDAGHELVMAIR